MTPEEQDLLVESPMDRYECCQHCQHGRRATDPENSTGKVWHDGHAGPCHVSPDCAEGRRMLGEPS